MKRLFMPASVIIALSLAACSPAPSQEAEGKRVRAAMREYRQAWMRGDSAAVLSHISKEIVLYMPSGSGKPKIGKDSVARFWFPPSVTSYPITSYEVTGDQVDVSGDFCIYSGVSRLTWHIQERNVHRDTTTSVSEFLNILRKENGEWKLYRIIYNLKDSDY